MKRGGLSDQTKNDRSVFLVILISQDYADVIRASCRRTRQRQKQSKAQKHAAEVKKLRGLVAGVSLVGIYSSMRKAVNSTKMHTGLDEAGYYRYLVIEERPLDELSLPLREAWMELSGGKKPKWRRCQKPEFLRGIICFL